MIIISQEGSFLNPLQTSGPCTECRAWSARMRLASEVLTSHVLNQEASLGVAGEPSRTREDVLASREQIDLWPDQALPSGRVCAPTGPAYGCGEPLSAWYLSGCWNACLALNISFIRPIIRDTPLSSGQGFIRLLLLHMLNSKELIKRASCPIGPCVHMLTLCDPVGCSLQAPRSMGFPRQECWRGLPCPRPVD